MYSEPNHHSRNLKLISLMFILYWVLGLAPLDDAIRLSIINYKIQNTSALFWVAHLVLFYFAWRFYLSAKGKVRHGYRNFVAVGSFSNQQSSLSKALLEKAKLNYIEKHKDDFQGEREAHASANGVNYRSDEAYLIYLLEFKYEGDVLALGYQVQYERAGYESVYFKDFRMSFGRCSWLWFRFSRFIRYVLSKEDSPDYILPWVLLGCAAVTSALNCFGVTAAGLMQ